MLVMNHTLDDAEIKLLPTINHHLVTVAPDKTLTLIGAELVLDETAGPYSNVSSGAGDVLYLWAGTRITTETPSNQIFGVGGKTIARMNSRNGNGFAVALTLRQGGNLEIRCSNTDGNFTGGNAANKLRVFTYYNLLLTG
jgi:hypothetical protein